MNSISPRNEETDLAKSRVSLTFAFQVLVWVVSGVMTYSAITNRIVAVETKQEENRQRMERIERGLDRLDSKMDQLLQRVPR